MTNHDEVQLSSIDDCTDSVRDEGLIDAGWIGHTNGRLNQMELELYVLQMRMKKMEAALFKAGLDWTLK